MSERYFFDHLGRVIDLYSKAYDRIIIMGDFNSEPYEDHVQTFRHGHNFHNFVKENTCHKGPPSAMT